MRSRTRSTLLGLGFSEKELEQPLSTLSGGQRNKAQLARLLLSDTNLLLLDEPTNHLDMDSLRFLEDFLRGYAGAFLVISHDRYFLDRVTTRTLELKHGQLLQSSGSYSRHIELNADRNEVLRRHYANQQKEIRRLEGVIEQQRRWNQARNYVTIASKQKQIERLKEELTPPEADTASIRFHFKADEPGGNDVLMASGLKKVYSRPLFSELSLHIRKGERVFLLGPNGCGKTTLLRLLLHAGNAKPPADAPRLYEGRLLGLEGKRVSCVFQEDRLLPWRTAQKNVALVRPEGDAAALLRSLDLPSDALCAYPDSLSGGMRRRVAIARALNFPGDILLLDEPFKGLDEATRALVAARLRGAFPLTLLVTHDPFEAALMGADHEIRLEPNK